MIVVVMAAMMIVTWTAPKISAAVMAPKTLQEAFWGPLREYFSRPEALTVLSFIVLYKIGDTMASTMTLPFILEVGFSREEYVAIVKLWGPMATFAGGLIGGHFALQLGIMRSLWIMGILQALSTACFSLLKFTGPSNWALAGIIGFENLTAQMGTAAYAAYMASITNVRFTATQYALLSSLMAIPGAVFAGRTGFIAEQLGWAGFFSFCALIAIPGMFLIPLLSHERQGPVKNFFRLSLISLTVSAGVYALVANARDIFLLF